MPGFQGLSSRGKSILFWSCSSNFAGNTTRYIPIGNAAFTSAGTTLTEEIRMRFAGVLKNMTAKVNTAPAGADTVTFTIYKNGSPTALSVVLTGAEVIKNNTSDEIPVSYDDIIVLWEQSSATAVAHLKQSCVVELVAD
jgi:hypothetical protein